jgi:hypothetical protein
MTYAPTEVTATVASGTTVRVVEETNYPFSEHVRLTLDTPHAVRFPLSLRIPAWCRAPRITVNGAAHPSVTPGTFAVLDRLWQPGDVVVVSLPMAVETVPGVNSSVSVRRGPLLYALKIQETWGVLDQGPRPGFDSYQVTPASDWNYGLVLDPQHPGASFTVTQAPMPPNPFVQAQTPVTLQAHARKVLEWTLAWNGKVCFDPPVSPVASSAATEVVTLVPFGAEMLRVTNFPVIGPPPPVPTAYRDDFASGHADGWVFYGGGWYVQGGALHAASNAGSGSSGLAGVKAVVPDTHFTDFTYDATVAVGGSGNAGLIFRVSKPGIGADAYVGYYAGLSAETGQVILGKTDNAWTQIQAVSAPVVADQAYHLRVVAEGPRLRVFLGDMTKPVVDVQDASCPAGAVGVRQYAGDPTKTLAAFSDLSVTSA